MGENLIATKFSDGPVIILLARPGLCQINFANKGGLKNKAPARHQRPIVCYVFTRVPQGTPGTRCV